jgi:hypothetical protein
VVHCSQELEARDPLGITSLFLVKEVESTEINQLTGDFKSDLILPLIDLRHGEVIEEDNQFFILEGTIVLCVLLLYFRVNRFLEVVRQSVEREVNSLERIFLR